jgi:26S proteasome regulatory subunit N2
VQGMIHANKGGSGDSTTITYLTEALKNAGVNEVVQHGACLGIGKSSLQQSCIGPIHHNCLV